MPNANFTCECNNSRGKSLVYCSFLGLKISLLKPDVPPAHLSCCGALLTQTDSLSCKKHFDLANFRIMKRRWYVLGDRCCAVTEGAVYARTWLRFDAVGVGVCSPSKMCVRTQTATTDIQGGKKERKKHTHKRNESTVFAI